MYQRDSDPFKVLDFVWHRHALVFNNYTIAASRVFAYTAKVDVNLPIAWSGGHSSPVSSLQELFKEKKGFDKHSPSVHISY